MRIGKPSCLTINEVTQAQCEAVMGNKPSKFQDPAHPVEQVTWDDIQPFLTKLGASPSRPSGAPTSASGLACEIPTDPAELAKFAAAIRVAQREEVETKPKPSAKRQARSACRPPEPREGVAAGAVRALER